MTTIHPDKHLENADWPKRTWNLPPYKSKDFMRIIGGEDALPRFRKLPVYKHAVRKGLIKDDEWQGES